jgi:predicted RNA-binding Zn-ribbon protein involved in translation (DUF1610 family)
MALHITTTQPPAAAANAALAPPACPRCGMTMDPSQVERGSESRRPLKLWHCGNCGTRLPRFDDCA